MNSLCAVCSEELVTRNQADDAWLFCPQKHGIATYESALREYLGNDAGVVDRIFERAGGTDRLGSRRCPRCRLPMIVCAVASTERALELDVCTGCRLVWFDPVEMRRLQVAAAESDDDTFVVARFAKSIMRFFTDE